MKTYLVYFENSRGIEREIAAVGSREAAFVAIDKFLNEHKYKSYYKNISEYPDGSLSVDVGSWTERFIVREGIE
jgi:hypothetical protein